MHARAITFLSLVATIVVSAPLLAQLPSPELLSLGSLGGQLGSTVSPLQNATGPLIATCTTLSTNGSELPSSPVESSTGIVLLRAQSELGVSNSRAFFWTREPWTIVTGNRSVSNATSIAADHFYQDECGERARCYYRVRLNEDRRVLFQSFARLLDSRARLNMTLTTLSAPQDSKTLFNANATIDRDAVMECDLKANVEYLLTVSDHLFRGGAEYRYAIVMRPAPAQSDKAATSPLSLLHDWQTACKHLQSLQNLEGFAPLNASFIHPRCSLLRPPAVDGHDISHVEEGIAEQPRPVTLPIRIAGAFDANDDVDTFEIECDKDASVAIEVVSQRLGELSDSMLVIEQIENFTQSNQKISRIADNDDMPSIGNGEMRFLIKDSLLVFKAPANGKFRVAVRSLQRTSDGTSRPRYVLELRQPKPGYLLATNWTHPIRDLDQSKMTSNTIATHGAMLLTLHAMRFDGFSAPIDFQVNGLPKSISGGQGTIAADQNLITVSLWHDEKNPDESTVNNVDRFTVTSSAKDANTNAILKQSATPLEVTWNAIDTFRSPLSRLSQPLMLYRARQRVCPLSIQLGESVEPNTGPVVVKAIRGQPLKVPVRVTRRAGAENAVLTVRLRQAPTRATAPELKFDAKSNEGTWDIQIPKDAPAGDYMLCALVEAAVSVPNTDAAAKDKSVNLTLQIPSTSVQIRIGDNL